ncbi:MAG: hypothetical protein KBD37_03735 [Burkholderiales bacterium]|nr:hypothetical protein [Burkholderiales bacterium]
MQETFISKARMSKYNDELEYVKNVKFSQFHYPLLHYFEITFRNKINGFYANNFGDNWLIELPSILNFDKSIIDRVNDSKFKIKNNIITNNDIIANLTLGFWVELFNPRYLLRTKLYKEQVYSIFAISKKNIHKKYLIKLHNELNTIRSFRNRIFHYEKVLDNPKYSHAPKILEYLLYRMDDKYYIQKMLKHFDIILTPPPRL